MHNSPPSSTGSCLRGCCPLPLLASTSSSDHQPRTITPGSAAEYRHEFAIATSSSLYTEFTNHESLPSLHQAFSDFNKAYPHYNQTDDQANRIRDNDYHHLSVSKHVCLDYIGHSLFSYSQSHSDTSISFDICHKPGNLNSPATSSDLESAMKRRIMDYMNIFEDDYDMVFTTNQSSAFKILAESYPFDVNKNIVSVYDHKNEGLDIMNEIAKQRGARVTFSEFSWPDLNIQSEKLRRKIIRKKKKKKGLFVFPLQSRVTGTRYLYQWMSLAMENGWHVLLDASALGPKEMDTFGLLISKPDFLFCSFYKIFGDNPSGFGCLFIKKSSASLLKDPVTASATGIVTLRLSNGESSESLNTNSHLGTSFSEIEELETPNFVSTRSKIECRGLDDADSIGLIMISCRARCLINWLVNALTRLKHPNHTISPVRIYGPKVKFDRGPKIAFNVFDWKGEKVDPELVQKLADRNNISLSCGVLEHVLFSDKFEEEKETGNLNCVSVSMALLTSFEDVYRVWVFVSRFLDADFVEKGRWRYKALNQQTVVI